MATISPYINFQNTLAALEFYKKLGATDFVIVKASDERFNDTPMAQQLDPDFVMNATFTILGQRIFCSDTWGNIPVDHKNSNICITFDLNNDEEVAQIKALEALAAQNGCDITMPLAPSEWTALFGMFKDPFGVSWMMSGE